MEQPPLSVDTELAEYLNRQFSTLANTLTQTNYFPPRTRLPEKVQAGRVYYFSQAIDATITSEGLWMYQSTGWVKL